MKKNLIIVLIILLPSVLFAQKAPFKFGKIDDKIVKLKKHPIDTSAAAVVLMDYGNTIFRYDNTDGFIFDFTRTIRIKILKKDGLNHGDIKVSYYHNGASHESISSIKGYSYNTTNGGVEKSKLEKSSIYKEKLTDNWDQVKITMPDVKIGTVVELTYKLTSPFRWNLQTWVFQNDIPTVHSEYKIIIPEYFDYQVLQSGYIGMTTSTKETGSGSVTINRKTSNDKGGITFSMPKTANTYSSEQLVFQTKIYRWVAKNVPAFKVEPYVASPSDYMSKVQFELRGTQYPNSPYDPYMGTWSALNRSFIEDAEFGEAIKLTGYMHKELNEISALSSDKEKIIALVELVKNQIEWNGEYRIYANNFLRSSWVDKKGSTADINLIIVAGLKKLGFEADPVLISTRGHGTIREQYAMSGQFNSVIAYLQLDGKTWLLDGTDKYLPVGVLPTKCLNGKGWKVSRTSPRWIEIKPTTKQERIVQATFDIDPGGTLIGIVELTEKGYAGYSQHKLFKLKGEEGFFEDFQTKNDGWLIDEYEYNSDVGYDNPFKSKYAVELNKDLTVAGDRIYLNPTVDEIMNENPFILEKREYPVDFAYPLRNAYQVMFNIPAGYEVEALPKPAIFAMPNKYGKFLYNISNTGRVIQLTVDFKINKTFFTQTEYAMLKQFYHRVVQKCEEQVVLKKSTKP